MNLCDQPVQLFDGCKKDERRLSNLLIQTFIPEAQFATKMRFHLLSDRTKPDGSLR